MFRARVLVCAHRALDGALVFFLAQRLPLVVRVLALTECNLEFGQPFLVDEEFQWHDGLAGILDRIQQLAQLALGEQQFAVAFRLVVIVRPESVRGDVHSFHPQLAVNERAVRVSQSCFAFTNRLDFGTEKLQSGSVAVEDQIIERRALIFDVYVRFWKHVLSKKCAKLLKKNHICKKKSTFSCIIQKKIVILPSETIRYGLIC